MTYKDLLLQLKKLNKAQLKQTVLVSDGDVYKTVYSLQTDGFDDENDEDNVVALSCVAGTG